MPVQNISNDQKEMILKIVTQGLFDNELFERLPFEKQLSIEKLIHVMGFKFHNYEPHKAVKQIFEEVEILHGQIKAGNNSPQVRLMLRENIELLYKHGYISRGVKNLF